MRHEIKWSILLSLRVQICLLSSVEFLRCGFCVSSVCMLVTDLDGVAIEDFSKLVVSREVIVY